MTAPRVVTVTMNPALDLTVFVDGFTAGAVNRAQSFRRQPGGKGLNVAVMLAAAGVDVTVSGFLGRDNAAPFEQLFAARRLRDRFLRVEGETRTGIKIVDRVARETTDVNVHGVPPTVADVAHLEAIVSELSQPGAWLIFAGSLPPAVEPRALARLVEVARGRGAKVAVDTSGPALVAAVDAGVDLVKPNDAELGELVGATANDGIDVPAEACRLHERGVAHVVVSRGKRGALFVAADGAVVAQAPPVEVVSTVGAGDALLAGYLAALLTGQSLDARARAATVFSWCALESIERTLVDGQERERRAAQIEVQPLS